MLTFEKCEEAAHYQGCPRAGYTFTYIRPLQSFLLFGGGNNDNETYIYSITKAAWSTQPTGGPKKPPSRKYHAAAFLENISCLLVIGGEDDFGRCVEDFFVLSIKDWKWRKLIVVKCPTPRERHFIYARSEKELVLFGGISHYDEKTNDIWLMKAQYDKDGKQENLSLECSKVEPKGKLVPEGCIVAESTFFRADRLYAGCFEEKDSLKIFCFDFRQAEWRELEFSMRCTQAKMFRAVRSNQEGFVLSISSAEQKKNSPSRYFLYDFASNRFTKLEAETDFVSNCDEMTGEGAEPRILCLRQGKRIFTVRYDIEEVQQAEGSIEDYSIAIKQEQMLSQELARKNSQLEELYREMQNYITQLHKQYVRFEEDPDVEAERSRHIEDCHRLKKEYAKFDRYYESANEKIRNQRCELGTVNEEFERCMETEFDEQA